MEFNNQEEMMVWSMTMAAVMAKFADKPPPGMEPVRMAGAMADSAVSEFRKRRSGSGYAADDALDGRR